jgi:hypothetical protein
MWPFFFFTLDWLAFVARFYPIAFRKLCVHCPLRVPKGLSDLPDAFRKYGD